MSLRSYLIRTINQRAKLANISTAAVNIHRQQYKHYQRDEETFNYKKIVATALLGSVLVGSSVSDNENNSTIKQKTQAKEDAKETFEAGQKKPDLPTFRADEVSKHDNKDSFWVTYKHGVYDVTKFLVSHPGGEQILNAAGLSIEPFWNVYGMHKTPEVYKLLETFRIGNLHDDDVVDHTDDELWVKEPLRDKRLIVKTAKPFNAETPAKLQIEHFDTPNELFYVRQHMPVPELNASDHRLRITIKNGNTIIKEFTLNELDSLFERVSVRAALMCAGNRRSEMNKQVKPVKGLSWEGGAIGNAVWGGVRLRDVLLHCGLAPDAPTDGLHVVFTGSDIDATGMNFSTSIPLEQAMNPNGCIILATHMNGVPLPPDHGYPLRVIVPGAPAVRSVKWLESITVSQSESESHWHQKDYRSFNASCTWDTADFASAPPVYSLPVTSAICDPADGDTVPPRHGHIEVRGYAYSGGGAGIVRVDVSGDGGRSWRQAALLADGAPPPRHYAWALWAARLPLQPGQTEIEIWAKATDSNFNTQPETFEHIWNIRGILSNAYHKIKVYIKQ